MAATLNPTGYYNSAAAASSVDVATTAVTGEALLALFQHGNDWTTSGTPTGVVFDPAGDNQAFTQVGTTQIIQLNGQDTPVSLWRLNSVTNGKTAPVRATASAAHDSLRCQVRRVSGHDAADLIRAFNARQETDAGANDLPNTVTSAPGDLAVYFGMFRQEAAYVSAGDTAGHYASPGSGYPIMLSGSKAAAGAPATSTTGTFAYSDALGYANILLAVSVKAGAAPAAPTITGPSGKQMTGGFFDLSGGTN